MTDNYQDKPLSEFKPGDTFYSRTTAACEEFNILIEFESFDKEKCMAYGKSMSETINIFPGGFPVAAHARDCFLVSGSTFCFFNSDGSMPTNYKEK